MLNISYIETVAEEALDADRRRQPLGDNKYDVVVIRDNRFVFVVRKHSSIELDWLIESQYNSTFVVFVNGELAFIVA